MYVYPVQITDNCFSV